MNAIPPKIRTMVPMLGSEQDGDVLAAARGIGRTLAGAGLSYHELAQAIPTQPQGPSLGDYRPYRREPQAGRAKAPSGVDHSKWPNWREAWARAHRTQVFTERQQATLRAQARYCREEDRGRLNPRERRFVSDCGKLHGRLSIAQADWLVAITDRLEQEDRAQWQ